MSKYLSYILVVVSLVFLGCEEKPIVSILPQDIDLEEGDIVFRLGESVESRMVTLYDSDGNYSHTGIVVSTDSGLMVAHAVPGEPDFEGDPSRVKLDHAGKFFWSDRAVQGSIKRHKNKKVAKEAAKHALNIYKRGMLFDSNYDDYDSTTMYCCEFVNHVYTKSGSQLCPKGLHQENILIVRAKNCIFPSDIYNSKDLTLIKTF